MPNLYVVDLMCSSNLRPGEITASPEIQRSLNLNPGGQLVLCAGNRKFPVRYAKLTFPAAASSLYIADDVRQGLLLPVPLTLNLNVGSKPGLWRLGPLVGIFANRFEKPLKPFGEQTGFFRKLRSAAGDLHSFCFAFYPGDVDWENRVIHGSIPPLPGDESTGWLTRALPFPDVIYDRGLFPRGDRRKAAAEARKVFRKYPGVQFYNPAFFGKWKTHRLLAKHETLGDYLPETRLYTAITDVYELLAKHGTVYLKPSGGSSGKGIIRLTSSPSGWVANFRVGRQVKKLEGSRQDKFEDRLKQLMGKREYIVQQGLKLAEFKGHPFDVRILMQKNRLGRWLFTGMAARIAGPGNFLSNLHAGGQAARISIVLNQVFPHSPAAGQIKNQIRKLSFLAASWVSSEGNPLFGEIAVDLGIDETGKVWVIELNAIPGRSVFRRIGAEKVLARAVSRPMEYACFLAGFTRQTK